MARKAAKGTGKKRKVSGKRGRTTRKVQKSVDPRGVIGIAILCLGLLALFSQFIPSGGGFLRSCMYIARGLGGKLCLLLPVVVCWTGVVLVFFGEKHMSLRTLISSGLIFLFVETMFQVFQSSNVFAVAAADQRGGGYWDFLVQSYKMSSMDCSGGGFIGALLAWPLVKALDIWGAMIVLIFATTIVLMVLTGMSFAGTGMRLSEWADDFRSTMRERREEKNALRSAREEEELEREDVRALERQKKRMARAQAEREEKERQEELERQEKERLAREQEEKRKQEEQAEEPELPEEEEIPPRPSHRRVRKEKPDLRVMRPEYEVPLSPLPEERRPVRRYVDIPDSMPLYIERDDEFTRDTIDERRERRTARPNFTIAEAEEAFLHGMDHQNVYGGQSPYARPSVDPVQQVTPVEEMFSAPEAPYAGQPAEPAWQDDAAYDPQSVAGNPYARPETEAPIEPGDMPEAYDPQEAYPQETPVYMPQSECEPEYESEYEPPYEAPQSDDDFPAYDAPSSDDSSVMEEEDDAFDVPEEEEIEYDDGEAQVTGSSFGGWSAASSRQEPARESAGDSPLARSIKAAAARAPQVQNVLEKQEAPQPIVQLRGNRLDGTPIVMPAKDTHEAPKAPADAYVFPPLDLLDESRVTQDPNQRAKDEAGAQKLLETLESFGVQAKLIHVTHGPAITRYELQPAPGVKVSRIVNLVDDIALNMASDGVRIEAPIPGKPAVGIEIPNRKTEMVCLRDVLQSQEMMNQKSPTAVALGKSVSGAPVIADIAKMPHVLIAGATGSGKSVCINTIINSVIFRASPREVRLILIDPKVVELSVYNGIPHLLVPVVTDPKKASAALSWAVVEMEHRYKRFESMGVRDIRGYNAAIGPDEEPMSKIIVIIDELADLMMVAPGEVEESICRLAQLARAAGIHLVIATQRPSVNVITGVIKANIPSRIAFAVSSQIDSRTILDSGGAEKLLGKGDMLYAPQGAGKPTRVQGCFVSDDEVQRIVDFVRGQHSADYNEDVIEQMDAAAKEDKAASGDAPSANEPVDEMLSKAIELAVDAGQVSISMLQRRLRVGYARAGRLVDEMTLRGITAEAEGPTKPRNVLISREEWKKMQENQE